MKHDCLYHLTQGGIALDDAVALRRISMTLHRWFELEWGDGNNHGSWAIVRGTKTKEGFVHDDDGKPYLEHHHYRHGAGQDTTTHIPLADRERGALKRLERIMTRYSGFVSYVQGDPRGCALYILPPAIVARLPDGGDIGSIYSSGIAVYK